MQVNKVSHTSNGYPARLLELASSPKELFVLGTDLSGLLERPLVAVVGSRNVSAYGRRVTIDLVGALAEHGVVIVSGLALGVDSIAHAAALEAGGLTLAVMPGGLDKIYPASHTALAKRILESGGSVISEYPAGTPAFKQNFIARNRIVSGISDALLITEAAEKSGSLHTARFALEQGRDVLAVPGNITSPTSVGTNNLIRTGAIPVTSVDDILYALDAEHLPSEPTRRKGTNAEEQAILDLLYAGTTDGHELLVSSQQDTERFNTTLTMLEISGKIRALGGNQWTLK